MPLIVSCGLLTNGLPSKDKTSETMVGPSGGTISLASGASIVIPAGALSSDVRFEARTLEDAAAISSAYGPSPFTAGIDLKPDGIVFSQPVAVKLPTGQWMPPGSQRAVFSFDKAYSVWEESPYVGTVDETGEFLDAQVGHFCPVVVSPFQMNIFAAFQSRFDGTNAKLALDQVACGFMQAMGLGPGVECQDGNQVRVVQGLSFTLDCSIYENGSLQESNAVVAYGDPSPGADGKLNIRSQSYDYMLDQDTQIVYWVELYVAMDPPETGDFSAKIYDPFDGDLVDAAEVILAGVRRGATGRAVAKVEFYVDGQIHETVEREHGPYYTLWNTSSLPDGAYALKVVAYNVDGVVAVSPEVKVQKGDEDRLPPVPGGFGIMSFSDVKDGSMRLTFKKGTDRGPSSDGNLRYRAVRSTSADIGSVAEITPDGAPADGAQVLPWTKGSDLFAPNAMETSIDLIDLDPNTDYYANVLVKDEKDNIACYKMARQRTTGLPPPLGASFFDQDDEIAHLSGPITVLSIDPAKDDREVIAGYRLYWGGDASAKLAGLDPIGDIDAAGSAYYTYALAEHTIKPFAASHILIYSRSSEKEGASPFAQQIVDNYEKLDGAYADASLDIEGYGPFGTDGGFGSDYFFGSLSFGGTYSRSGAGVEITGHYNIFPDADVSAGYSAALTYRLPGSAQWSLSLSPFAKTSGKFGQMAGSYVASVYLYSSDPALVASGVVFGNRVCTRVYEPNGAFTETLVDGSGTHVRNSFTAPGNAVWACAGGAGYLIESW